MTALAIDIEINGQPHRLEVGPTDILVDVLRDRLGYVGTHKVCAQGICGACTVLMNGRAITACLTLAAQADGCAVTTVEGLESEAGLAPLQEAFMRHGAVQCGYCTPGFLMAAQAYLQDEPSPDRARIADALRGNICRCTGYTKIIDAVAEVAAVVHGNATDGKIPA